MGCRHAWDVSSCQTIPMLYIHNRIEPHMWHHSVMFLALLDSDSILFWLKFNLILPRSNECVCKQGAVQHLLWGESKYIAHPHLEMGTSNKVSLHLIFPFLKVSGICQQSSIIVIVWKNGSQAQTRCVWVKSTWSYAGRHEFFSLLWQEPSLNHKAGDSALIYGCFMVPQRWHPSRIQPRG